ncbi:MAG: gliding motility protein GldN [Ilyomonas sp.]
MKSQYYKYFIVLLVCAMIVDATSAQTRNSRRRTGSAYGNSAYGNTNTPKTDTTQPQSGYGNANAGNNSAYGATNNTNSGIDTTLPMNVIQGGSSGLMDSTRPSLRNDASIERNLVKDRTPLEYQNIREDDAVYRVRVWREIDTREKLNMPFRYAAVEDNGSQRFISILLKAIKDGDVTAFSADDDRFTTPITPEQAMSAFGGGYDTSRKFDLQGNVVGYEVRAKVVDPDSIYKFRIKEEWVFDKNTSRLTVRILGIAPIIPVRLSTGETLANSEHATWWVYYPDMRPVLAKYEVYNPKNFGARMTWEELFESRMFSSYIIKSSLDNPRDEYFSSYIKDPLFRLLEGENVKEKIFNYEQSLWSY